MSLDYAIIGCRRYEDKFAQWWPKFFGFLNLCLKFVGGDRTPVIRILALALHADQGAVSAAPVAKNIDAMLALSGPSIVLRAGVFEYVLEKKPHGPFKGLPVFRRRK
jgi:hypothetical protein